MKKSVKRRRLKKTIRRTIGALFMISAIIIAAIPFPDALAGGGGGGGVPESKTPYSYTKEASPSSINPINTGTVDLNTSGGTTFTSYIIRKTSSNAYMIYDQFDYKLAQFTGMSAPSGILMKYNNTYATETVSLTERVYANYYTITQPEYDNYYTSSEGTSITLDMNTDSSIELFKKFFPNKFNEYKEKLDLYNEYTTNPTQFEATHPGVPTPILAPAALTCNPSMDLSTDDLKKQYFCYKKLGYNNNNYTLESVICNTSKINTGVVPEEGKDTYIYVMRANSDEDAPDQMMKDENGFIVKETSSIIAIGADAFNAVTNVKYLTLPSEIKYIGDDAFRGSFVETISLIGTETIGNRAFSGCTQLREINMENATYIGIEAFYGCTGLKQISFPYKVGTIEKGAFAECINLNDVDLSFISTSTNDGGYIEEGAFFNCGLERVTFSSGTGSTSIAKLGDGAFACTNSGIDKMQSIDMSNAMKLETLGKKVLSGRKILENVNMPGNYGSKSSDVTLDADTFAGCNKLVSVVFPENCGNVKFDDTIFTEVTNDNFYVQGPEKSLYGPDASERISTWNTKNYHGISIPYRFIKDGNVYSEICKKDALNSSIEYIMEVDQNGVLTSCRFNESKKGRISNFVIPATVGVTELTGLGPKCFGASDDANSVLNNIEKLTIEKNKITTIDNEVFKGASSLKDVMLSSGITSIGDSAFEGCGNLEKVRIGYEIITTSISDGVAITPGVSGADDIIVPLTKQKKSIEQVGSSLSSIGNNAFYNCPKLKNIVFAPQIAGTSLPKENIPDTAFMTGGDELTITGEISSDFGPYVWSMKPDNYMNKELGVRVCYKTPEPSSFTVILDNHTNMPTLIDIPHYDDLRTYKKAILDSDGNEATEDVNIIDKYEEKPGAGDITPQEQSLVYSALNINIPSGIQSVDTKGYFSNTDYKTVDGVIPASNASNISTYFTSSKLPYVEQYKTYGLFSGYYGKETGVDGPRDYPEGSAEELIGKGNDRIESVIMNTVEYLPDNCFDSCEALETISLGSAMKDVGKLPIKDCTKLSSIAGNDNFVANNGILYQNLADGSKDLIECFPSRGSIVGTSTVSVANDPDLAYVSSIEPSAFYNCKSITSADFTGANEFEEIPNNCFENCEMLNEVDLPKNVEAIGNSAFADTGAYTKVTVRGKEVSLGSNAFENVNQAYVVSYKGSGVSKAARRQGANIDKCLDNMYTIKFYTYDGNTLIKSVEVEAGKTAEAPEGDEIPLRDGYTFTGWNKSLKNIQDDDFVLAVYAENGTITPGATPGVVPPGTTPGVTPANGTTPGTTPKTTSKVTPAATPSTTPTGSATKYKLTVVYGSGSGDYASGTTVIINAIEPPAGKVFDKWVVSGSGLTIASATSMATTVKTSNSDATVTATYKNTGSVSGNSSRNSNKSGGAIETRSTGNNKTTVDITKDGISNTDKAYASVKGSSDNFIVKISESADAANQVATALSKQYSDMNPIKYFAMDITLYDATGQSKIENKNGLSVNITMPIPDALVQYAGNNKIGAVVNGSLEVLNCKFITIDGIPCVSFTATHFSPYTVFVDTANLTEGTLDATPKTGDGIHPKWFVVMAFVCISLILLLKKDRVKIRVA